MTAILQRRDLEILRTLVRLRYVATRELLTTFFASPWVERRRLRRLSALDLITPHRKGIEERQPQFAWRLTPRGLEAVAEAFPDEPIPDGLAERLADGSLYNIAHRAGLTRLYLALLARRAGPMPEEDAASARTVIDALRLRGSQFWWQPDGDIVLRFQKLGENLQIVPDATVCGAARPACVFVELDRSTRSLSRIADTLERYAWYLRHRYAESFSSQRTPAVLYVVRSEGRKAGITHHANRILGDKVKWAVMTEADAPKWLEEAVIDVNDVDPELPEPAPGKEVGGLQEVAKSLYAWARAYDRQLRAEGRALPSEGEALLLQLHQELKLRKAHAG